MSAATIERIPNGSSGIHANNGLHPATGLHIASGLHATPQIHTLHTPHTPDPSPISSYTGDFEAINMKKERVENAESAASSSPAREDDDDSGARSGDEREHLPSETSKLLRGILQGREKHGALISRLLDDQENRGTFDTDSLLSPEESCSEEEEDSGEKRKHDEEDVNSEESVCKRSRHDTGRIGSSPTLGSDSSSTSCSENRPHKRKQYIPSRHEVERGSLRRQLRIMQDQLMEMQARCSGPDELGDLDPAHFIKQASRLVREQELAAGPSEALEDLTNLARTLKEEISHSVESVVDSIMTRFLAKRALPVVQNALKKQAESPKDDHEETRKPVITATPDKKAFSPPPPPRATRTPPCDDPRDRPCSPRIDRAKEMAAKMAGFPSSMESYIGSKAFPDMLRHHPMSHMFPPPFFPQHPSNLPSLPSLYHQTSLKEPEQAEPLSLVLNTPKKKRTKVTDTRLSPRAARALLADGYELDKLPHPFPPHLHQQFMPELFHHAPPLVPVSLPTSVAIPNPSLHQSDVLSMYTQREHAFQEHSARMHSVRSPHLLDHQRRSPGLGNATLEGVTTLGMLKHGDESYESQREPETYDGSPMTSTLTPMHLRKAKLMFFYVRYPSSAVLKIFFPDVKFNKNNTAQLVKWFSNFREFFYIQMEKYARQAIAEGVKTADDMTVSADSELYRVLNLHYNRNNQIEVPDHFRMVVQGSLREFHKALFHGKDAESSWKKAIYKIIARMDDQVPDYFKSPNWMEQLNDL